MTYYLFKDNKYNAIEPLLECNAEAKIELPIIDDQLIFNPSRNEYYGENKLFIINEEDMKNFNKIYKFLNMVKVFHSYKDRVDDEIATREIHNKIKNKLSEIASICDEIENDYNIKNACLDLLD